MNTGTLEHMLKNKGLVWNTNRNTDWNTDWNTGTDVNTRRLITDFLLLDGIAIPARPSVRR